MKQSRVLLMGYSNEYLVPESMSDKELSALIAQLLLMQPVSSHGYYNAKGNYDQAFYVSSPESPSIRIRRVEIMDEAKAKALVLESDKRREKQPA